MSLNQKKISTTAEKNNAPTADPSINVLDTKEQAAYWRKIPQYLALRYLGKYAVFLRNEEDRTEALERARPQLGWISRQKIIATRPFSAEINGNDTNAVAIFSLFFQKLGSKNALAESQLAAHYLSRYYSPDQLEKGDRVEIKNGYFYVWDRAGRLVSNYPFVQVYSADQNFNSSVNSADTDSSMPKIEIETETTKAKRTAQKPQKPSAANTLPLDLLSDDLTPSRNTTPSPSPEKKAARQTPPPSKKKPSSQAPAANTSPTTGLEDILPNHAPLAPEKLLQAARRDREKIWKTIHGPTLRRVLNALENSDYQIKIGFHKNDADNDPRIETAFTGVIMGKKYENQRALVHRFSGNGQMETSVFDRHGIKKRERTDDISSITANPKAFLIKVLNETYAQLPFRYRNLTFGRVRRIFDELIQIINDN